MAPLSIPQPNPSHAFVPAWGKFRTQNESHNPPPPPPTGSCSPPPPPRDQADVTCNPRQKALKLEPPPPPPLMSLPSTVTATYFYCFSQHCNWRGGGGGGWRELRLRKTPLRWQKVINFYAPLQCSWANYPACCWNSRPATRRSQTDPPPRPPPGHAISTRSRSPRQAGWLFWSEEKMRPNVGDAATILDKMCWHTR